MVKLDPRSSPQTREPGSNSCERMAPLFPSFIPLVTKTTLLELVNRPKSAAKQKLQQKTRSKNATRWINRKIHGHSMETPIAENISPSSDCREHEEEIGKLKEEVVRLKAEIVTHMFMGILRLRVSC